MFDQSGREKVFADKLLAVFETGTVYDADTLKRRLQERARQGVRPCIYLYRAWAIVQQCYCLPEWDTAVFRAVCWTRTEDQLTLSVAADLTRRFGEARIPATDDNSLDEDIDHRIYALDTLQRLQLAQAQYLGVELIPILD